MNKHRWPVLLLALLLLAGSYTPAPSVPTIDAALGPTVSLQETCAALSHGLIPLRFPRWHWGRTALQCQQPEPKLSIALS